MILGVRKLDSIWDCLGVGQGFREDEVEGFAGLIDGLAECVNHSGDRFVGVPDGGLDIGLFELFLGVK